MVKKLQKSGTAEKKSAAQLSGTVKESAQQIWLAGRAPFQRPRKKAARSLKPW